MQCSSKAAYLIPNCDHVVIFRNSALSRGPFQKAPKRQKRQLDRMRVERDWDSRRKLSWHCSRGLSLNLSRCNQVYHVYGVSPIHSSFRLQGFHESVTGFSRVGISGPSLAPQIFPRMSWTGDPIPIKDRLLWLTFVLFRLLLLPRLCLEHYPPHSIIYLSVAHHGRRSKETSQYLPPQRPRRA